MKNTIIAIDLAKSSFQVCKFGKKTRLNIQQGLRCCAANTKSRVLNKPEATLLSKLYD